MHPNQVLATERNAQALGDAAVRDGCTLADLPSIINKDTKIGFMCQCGVAGTKGTKMLLSGGGGFCSKCTNAAKTRKAQSTMDERYGKPYVLQVPEMLANSIATRRARAENETAETKAARRAAIVQMRLSKARQTTSGLESSLVHDAQRVDFMQRALIPRITCIYGWQNQENRRWYVGLTTDLRKRSATHLNASDGTLFHEELKEHPERFELYILRTPSPTSFACWNELIKWLCANERECIADLDSFRAGYNQTSGGQLGHGEIKAEKALKNFEVHKQAVAYYHAAFGALGACPRDYVIDAPDRPFHGVRLGDVLHKWRENPKAFYLAIHGNLDFLFQHGFTWTSKEAGVDAVHTMMQRRDDMFAEQWKSKWRPALIWTFAEFGHVNVQQKYRIPRDASIPDCIQGAAVGMLVNAFRTAEVHTQEDRRRFVLRLGMKTNMEWKSHLLITGLTHYVHGVFVEQQRGRQVPQNFVFPEDFHVYCLRNYKLGANLRNTMKRRHDSECVEAKRWCVLRRAIVAQLLLLHVRLMIRQHEVVVC
jgi:hypothetical protein